MLVRHRHVRPAVPTLRRIAAPCLVALLIAVLGAGVGLAEGLVPVDREPVPASPFAAAAAKASPGVVSIRVERLASAGGADLGPMQELYRRYFPEDGSGEKAPFGRPGTGTGFLVSDLGHVLTNNHVVAGAGTVRIRVAGEELEREAVVVGADPASDLALLSTDPEGLPAPLTFADSDQVRVGDWAVAVGNPFGNLAGSLTVGVVSAKGRRDLAIHGGAPRYQDFLQTDAAINFGNSGGPLLDIAGRVIGVNTAINAAGRGIGFAIPANYARRVAESLAEHGRVIRGWLGARYADHRVEGRPAGALIESVNEGSPAAVAGLAAGDVVLAFGEEPVADGRDLDFLVSEAELGTPLPCQVLREGRRIECAIELAEAPVGRTRDRDRSDVWFGMSLATTAGDDPRVARLREVFGTETDRGVMVVEVEPGSSADEAGVQVGDVILAVGEHQIADSEDLLAVRSDLGERPGTVTLLIESGGERSYLRLDPGPERREG